MSHNDDHDDDTHATRGASTIHATKPVGNGAKWLLGALAAVLVAGGGYLAWKNMPPATNDTQAAYNDTASTSPSDQSAPANNPFDQTQTAPADTASTSDSAAAPAPTPARRTTVRRTTQVATIQEETIGVSRVSDTTAGDDSVVVQGRRQTWAYMPSAQRLAAYYPDYARDSGREGEASLRCTIQQNGRLDACERISETPHSGFGQAALRIAHTLRHNPQLADGRDATGQQLNLHVVFRLADDDRRYGRG